MYIPWESYLFELFYLSLDQKVVHWEVLNYLYIVRLTVECKIVAGENIGKFGELNAIRQYFTQPNLFPFFCKTVDFWIKNLHICE